VIDPHWYAVDASWTAAGWEWIPPVEPKRRGRADGYVEASLRNC
jgi:hypothetical protein